MKHVVMFSGGGGSRASAKRIAGQFGAESMTLLFADTLGEDEDSYRGLIEMAADVYGVPIVKVADLAERARHVTPLEARNLPLRKSELRQLACDVMSRLPQLVWLQDGRTIWEVFHDERFIGNSRTDPCAKHLKRKLQDGWRDANCDPADTICYVGLDWSEKHRMEGRPGKPGLRQRMADIGWRYEAPMCEPPYVTKEAMLAQIERDGIRLPRLYKMGFPHNNCGGQCVKQGQAAWAHSRQMLPERFRWSKEQEQEAQEFIGTTETMLKDRRGGTRKTLSLVQLEQRILAKEEIDDEWGGCGCSVE